MQVTINLDEITNEMDILKDEKARLALEVKKIDKEIEKRELQLSSFLTQSKLNEYTHGVYSFGIKEVHRTSLDQKMLKEKYPEQYSDCYITKMSEKFEFKINK